MTAEDLPRAACRFRTGKFGKERPGDKQRGSNGPGIGGGNEAGLGFGCPLCHGLKQSGADGGLITEEEERSFQALFAEDGFKSRPDGTPHAAFKERIADDPNGFIREEGLDFGGIRSRHDPDRICTCPDCRIHGMKGKGPPVPGDQRFGSPHPGRFAGGEDNGSDSVHTGVDALGEMGKLRD